MPLVVNEPAAGPGTGTEHAAASAEAARIAIDIDPVVSAGFIHERYDLSIRGRAVSSAPLEEVAISLEGAAVGRVQFGAADQLELDDDSGILHVFHINVPLPRAQANRTCQCVVAARTQTGNVRSETYELAIDPAGPLPVTVISGPTSSSHAYTHARPPVVLYVERAAMDGQGQVLVHGWAVSLNPMVTIQVFVEDERIGAAQLGGRRDDIGTAFPVYPNARHAGFTLSKAVSIPSEAVTTLRVQAISRHGFMHEVILPVERVRVLAAGQPVEATPEPAATVSWSPTLQPPSYRLEASFRIAPDLPTPLPGPLPASSMVPTRGTDGRRDIHFFCDELAIDAEGNLRAIGWAACAVGIAAIVVHMDGEPVGEAELGLPRQDVGEEYRHIPMARYSGFRLVKALGALPSGKHTIRVLLRNSLDDVEEEVRSLVIERAPPPPVPASATEFRLEIDTPTVVAGSAVEPVTGRLTIEGWALARSGVAGIEVLLDDQRLGEAHYGLARQDVGIAFPDWQDSVRSGYAFHCPPRSLRNGEHVVQLHVRARSGQVLEHRFNIQVRKSEEAEEGLTIRRRVTQVEMDVGEDLLSSLGHRPAFHLVLRQDTEVDAVALLATIDSLRHQAYRDWQLEILVSGRAAPAEVRVLLAETAADLCDRISVVERDALEQPIGSGGGDGAGLSVRLICFLLPGDRLGCDALLRIALASGLRPDADLLYADEVRISPASREREPFFKPDFSPDLLLSTNYIGRPWFAAAGLLDSSGVRRCDLLEHGEYDALLRCAEQARQVQHVPDLLCRRGPSQIDDATLEKAALSRAAARLGVAAEVSAGAVSGTWRLRRTEPASGLVSIIIPTCGSGGFIERCIESLRQCTAYRDFEIVCVDNIPDQQVAWKLWLQQNADTIVPMPDGFNWSRFNNSGVKHAKGEFLLFLNDDIEVLRPEWLDAMLEHARRPEVAVIGPQLLYPDNKVQHAGMFLAKRGTARHAFRFAAADEPGYFGLALTQRNVIAVTGACMLMRRSVYEALGGFEEAHDIINNDLDFCLRAHRAGMRIIFTPYASLVHHEAASRDRLEDTFDLGQFEARWNTLFSAGDPYFSPRLSRHSDDYRPDDEPIETIFPGHPLFRHADIKRILVVKVDLIGDFVTAIPAIRRLKRIFQSASIHLLASRAARAFVAVEDCIDELIEFEFFHSVSGLGQKQIGKEDYQALRERLAPYHFDIAVDLRKHPDTREVLRHTPARFLAGYDHMGQFPYLDIALEWEGDRQLQRKRSHVTDDLINLVEAIGTAGTAERTRLSIAAPPDFLPEDVRALFEKPVVAVHPGVGNAMRQWPAEHFASLVNLMVERDGVNAVLIGGPEEAELAGEVLGQIGNRGCVASLIGKTSLQQLPALLQACALYVGNNSGPKHIAAALGVPTIGIHSGVVDAVEWGPIGRRSVAVRRNMSCSPCYLARLEDCPRGFACMNGLEPMAVLEVAELLLGRRVERWLVEPTAEPSRKTRPKPVPKVRRSRKRQVSAVPAG
ncbi:MAG TPA: glycosyltransferase family 9 protein [Acetobacteraceae bacterium]